MRSAPSWTATARSWCGTGCRRTACRPPCARCWRMPVVAEGEAATIDPDWGEPGLTAGEKIYGWNSFIVLAMLSGRPENPVNAVAPERPRALPDPLHGGHRPGRASSRRCARIWMRTGFPEIAIETCRHPHAGEPHRPRRSLGGLASASMERSLGKRVQVIPNAGGGLPGDVFVDHLRCRWCGFRTATTAASSTARTSIFLSRRRARVWPPSPAFGGIWGTRRSQARPAAG